MLYLTDYKLKQTRLDTGLGTQEQPTSTLPFNIKHKLTKTRLKHGA